MLGEGPNINGLSYSGEIVHIATNESELKELIDIVIPKSERKKIFKLSKTKTYVITTKAISQQKDRETVNDITLNKWTGSTIKGHW